MKHGMKPTTHYELAALIYATFYLMSLVFLISTLNMLWLATQHYERNQ